MPNFDLKVVSGATARAWDDPRLNHRSGAVHIYRRVSVPTSPAIVSVVLHAIVGGVEAPLDGALGGDLFVVARLAWSGSFPFAIVQTVGQTSEITLKFAHNMLGHQELYVRRSNGGGIALSFEVES